MPESGFSCSSPSGSLSCTPCSPGVPGRFGFFLALILQRFSIFFLIIFVVERLLFDSGNNKIRGLLALTFVLKTVILLLAFFVGVHFVGNRIILSVINYAVQVMVLSIFLYKYFYGASGVEGK